MNTKLLSIEQDKQGNILKINQTEKLAYSTAYSFFLREYARSVDEGYSHPVTCWDDHHCGAIYVESNGVIVGINVYSEHKLKECLWSLFIAVDKDYKNRGIYTVMFSHFEKLAKEKNLQFIASYVHVDNEIRLLTADKVGMKPVFYVMHKQI
jgi:GNAT superfamily N-acetyltransferase